MKLKETYGAKDVQLDLYGAHRGTSDYSVFGAYEISDTYVHNFHIELPVSAWLLLTTLDEKRLRELLGFVKRNMR